MTMSWTDCLSAVEAIVVGGGSVGELLTAAVDGEIEIDDLVDSLAPATLGAVSVATDGEGGRLLLAVPARVNTLSEALGETYWQALAAGPPKVVVAKGVRQRIGNVRHDVLLIDVAAWRAWALEHRDPSSITSGQLKSFVERIERLEEEKQTIADDIKDVYAEAKSNGFDTKILRQVVRIRKQDPDVRAEEEALLEVYLQALGMGFGRSS